VVGSGNGEVPPWGTPAGGTATGGAPAEGSGASAPPWGTPSGDGPSWRTPGAGAPPALGARGRASFDGGGCVLMLVGAFFWAVGAFTAIDVDEVVGRWLDVRWSLTTDATERADAGWPGYDTVDVPRGTRLYVTGDDPLSCEVGDLVGGWTPLAVRPEAERDAEFTAATSPVQVRCSATSSFVHLWRDDAEDRRRFHLLAPVAAWTWFFAVGAVITAVVRVITWSAYRQSLRR
jgi:hypothetical protein